MSAVTQLIRDAEVREQACPDANRRAYMAKRRADWEARSQSDRGMSGPPTASAKVTAAQETVEPQGSYRREMLDASCVDHGVPLGFCYPQRPLSGPTVADYYARKERMESNETTKRY